MGLETGGRRQSAPSARNRSNSTALAACGRPGYLSVYWAGERSIHIIDWGMHNGWVPAEWALPLEVDVVPGTPLYAMCRSGEYNGVVWAGDGVIHHVYQSFIAWGEWQYATLDTFGMTKDTPLAAVGRPGYLSVWWAANKKVARKHWGLQNDWTPQDEEIDVDVDISPGTLLYAASRPDQYDGVFWAGDREIHHLSHNSTDWKSFTYEKLREEGVTKDTLLAACGRSSPGWVGVFWAGKSKIHLKHWDAAHAQKTRSRNAWRPSQELPPMVPAAPGLPLAALCRDGEYMGVVWESFGQTVQVYKDLMDWEKWKFSQILRRGAGGEDPALGTCGRPGFSSLYWAGEGQIHTKQWGLHTTGGPVETVLPLRVDIGPGTPLYGMTRPHEYNGVVWAGEGVIHHAYEDFLNWGKWKYAPLPTVGVTPSTPLGATGQTGFLSVWWACSRRVCFKHMGVHNNWVAEDVELPIDVPLQPGAKIYAFSRSGEHNGVFWAGDGEIHHVFHSSSSWVEFKHEKYAQREITPHTPLAACGRPGWHGVFWAGHSKIHTKQWSEATGWRPVDKALPAAVNVEPGTRLSAMCRDGEYSGVVWDVGGKTYHLYEDLQSGGNWRYEQVVAKPEAEIVAWNSWVNASAPTKAKEVELVQPALEVAGATERPSGISAGATSEQLLYPALGVVALVVVMALGRAICGRKGKKGDAPQMLP